MDDFKLGMRGRIYEIYEESKGGGNYIGFNHRGGGNHMCVLDAMMDPPSPPFGTYQNK